MKKTISGLAMLAMLMICFMGNVIRVEAKGMDTINKGIFINQIDVSGMTEDEAMAAVTAYLDGTNGKVITLKGTDAGTVSATPADLGMSWANPEIIKEALNYGKTGNIVKRYKALKDLENETKVFPLQLEFDKTKIASIVENDCSLFNQEAVDMELKRVDGAFTITDGAAGYVVDNQASEDAIYNYLTTQWNYEDAAVDLVIVADEPKGTREDLEKVKDVLGTFTTSYSTSGSARSANVANGCSLVNGTTVYPGETFSMYENISPFSVENGYYLAGSYLNGMVVDSLGGGICQVSTTLYNAVLLSELEVTERNNHSMIVGYVTPSKDAAIAESSGKDFKFVNNLEYPIYIEGTTSSNKQITFTIYGAETRPSNREVTYESEVLQTINPTTETIIQDPSQPVGFMDVQSAHIGYKARLWKIVKVDGAVVSKDQVNSSTYKMVPRTATVGIATSNPDALAQIQAAIASGSIDQTKAVAGAWAAANAAVAAAAQAPVAPVVDTPVEGSGEVVQ